MATSIPSAATAPGERVRWEEPEPDKQHTPPVAPVSLAPAASPAPHAPLRVAARAEGAGLDGGSRAGAQGQQQQLQLATAEEQQDEGRPGSEQAGAEGSSIPDTPTSAAPPTDAAAATAAAVAAAAAAGHVASGGPSAATAAWLERYTKRVKAHVEAARKVPPNTWRPYVLQEALAKAARELPEKTKFGDQVVSKILLLSRWKHRARARANNRGFTMAARRPWLAHCRELTQRYGNIIGSALEHSGVEPHVDMVMQNSAASQDQRIEEAAAHLLASLTPMETIRRRVKSAMHGVRMWTAAGKRVVVGSEGDEDDGAQAAGEEEQEGEEEEREGGGALGVRWRSRSESGIASRRDLGSDDGEPPPDWSAEEWAQLLAEAADAAEGPAAEGEVCAEAEQASDEGAEAAEEAEAEAEEAEEPAAPRPPDSGTAPAPARAAHPARMAASGEVRVLDPLPSVAQLEADERRAALLLAGPRQHAAPEKASLRALGLADAAAGLGGIDVCRVAAPPPGAGGARGRGRGQGGRSGAAAAPGAGVEGGPAAAAPAPASDSEAEWADGEGDSDSEHRPLRSRGGGSRLAARSGAGGQGDATSPHGGDASLAVVQVAPFGGGGGAATAAGAVSPGPRRAAPANASAAASSSPKANRSTAGEAALGGGGASPKATHARAAPHAAAHADPPVVLTPTAASLLAGVGTQPPTQAPAVEARATGASEALAQAELPAHEVVAPVAAEQGADEVAGAQPEAGAFAAAAVAGGGGSTPPGGAPSAAHARRAAAAAKREAARAAAAARARSRGPSGPVYLLQSDGAAPTEQAAQHKGVTVTELTLALGALPPAPSMRRTAQPASHHPPPFHAAPSLPLPPYQPPALPAVPPQPHPPRGAQPPRSPSPGVGATPPAGRHGSIGSSSSTAPGGADAGGRRGSGGGGGRGGGSSGAHEGPSSLRQPQRQLSSGVQDQANDHSAKAQAQVLPPAGASSPHPTAGAALRAGGSGGTVGGPPLRTAASVTFPLPPEHVRHMLAAQASAQDVGSPGRPSATALSATTTAASPFRATGSLGLGADANAAAARSHSPFGAPQRLSSTGGPDTLPAVPSAPHAGAWGGSATFRRHALPNAAGAGPGSGPASPALHAAAAQHPRLPELSSPSLQRLLAARAPAAAAAAAVAGSWELPAGAWGGEDGGTASDGGGSSTRLPHLASPVGGGAAAMRARRNSLMRLAATTHATAPEPLADLPSPHAAPSTVLPATHVAKQPQQPHDPLHTDEPHGQPITGAWLPGSAAAALLQDARLPPAVYSRGNSLPSDPVPVPPQLQSHSQRQMQLQLQLRQEGGPAAARLPNVAFARGRKAVSTNGLAQESLDGPDTLALSTALLAALGPQPPPARPQPPGGAAATGMAMEAGRRLMRPSAGGNPSPAHLPATQQSVDLGMLAGHVGQAAAQGHASSGAAPAAPRGPALAFVAAPSPPAAAVPGAALASGGGSGEVPMRKKAPPRMAGGFRMMRNNNV